MKGSRLLSRRIFSSQRSQLLKRAKGDEKVLKENFG